MDEQIRASDQALDAAAQALEQHRASLDALAEALRAAVAKVKQGWPDEDGATLCAAMTRAAGMLAEPAGAAAALGARARGKAELLRQHRTLDVPRN